MFSIFKKKKKLTLSSILAEKIATHCGEEEFLESFHATAENDWFDFESHSHSYREFSKGLFEISALRIFNTLKNDALAIQVLDCSAGEKIFLECLIFPYCAIQKLDDEECLRNIDGGTGHFYELDGWDLVIDEVIDISKNIPELSFIDPVTIGDFFIDRINYYSQLKKENTDDFFKALCYLFSLAVRQYGDLPVDNILNIDVRSPILLQLPFPFAGQAIQSAAEESLYNLITIAKRTMYGYRESDFE